MSTEITDVIENLRELTRADRIRDGGYSHMVLCDVLGQMAPEILDLIDATNPNTFRLKIPAEPGKLYSIVDLKLNEISKAREALIAKLEKQ